MDRRTLILAMASLSLSSKTFVSTAIAAPKWQAKFVSGIFDGSDYQAGLSVKMEPSWKTYWRNPGEAGIPPTLSAEGENFEALRLEFPLPSRIVDESGEAIGYHDEVVFPLYFKPKDLSKPLNLKLSAFFGVCQQICMPVKLEGDLKFKFSSDAKEAALIGTWQERVPKLGQISVLSHITDEFLILDLADKFDDIFVEGPDRLYFRKPDFAKEPGKAWVKIDGLKKAGDLKNIELRLTAAKSGQGLEQYIALA